MATVGIRLANVVLFVLSCSVAANVITDVAASVVVPSRMPTPPVPEIQTAAAPRWQDRQVILDRNLFGAQVVDDPVVAEAPPDEDIEETKLPLTLLGTISSEDQRVASAAIQNSTTREHEVVKVGDYLTGLDQVRVERIDRGRVVLLNRNEREVLTLEEDTGATLARAVPQVDRSSRASRRTGRRSRAARSSVRDRLEQLADDDGPRGPAALFSQARILPKYENGSMVGIELSKIKDDSLYQKVGLQDGDILTSVNGVSIDNPSATAEVIRNLQGAEELILERRRADGSQDTITVDASILQEYGALE
jgi:general secretion pathway protein C